MAARVTQMTVKVAVVTDDQKARITQVTRKVAAAGATVTEYPQPVASKWRVAIVD
jgi:hypothetical protein